MIIFVIFDMFFSGCQVVGTESLIFRGLDKKTCQEIVPIMSLVLKIFHDIHSWGLNLGNLVL